MREDEFGEKIGSLIYSLIALGALLVVLIGLFFYLSQNPSILQNSQRSPESAVAFSPEMVQQLGFIDDKSVELVIMNCTSCHSAKLVTQNRATKEGWRSMIRWMQRTQNLKDLGDAEEAILDYLSKNYAPTNQSRRANLKDVEWYRLD